MGEGRTAFGFRSLFRMPDQTQRTAASGPRHSSTLSRCSGIFVAHPSFVWTDACSASMAAGSPWTMKV